MLKYSKIFAILLVIVITLIDLITGYFVMVWDMDFLHMENGYLENIQIAILLLSALLLTLHAQMEKGSCRFYCAAAALLFFSFFMRELDLKSWRVPSILLLVGSGMGKKIMLTTLWLCLAGYGLLIYRRLKVRDWPELMLSFFGCYLMFGMGLLIMSGFFDKQIIETSYNQFYEEVLELNGYFFIIMSFLLFNWQKRF